MAHLTMMDFMTSDAAFELLEGVEPSVTTIARPTLSHQDRVFIRKAIDVQNDLRDELAKLIPANAEQRRRLSGIVRQAEFALGFMRSCNLVTEDQVTPNTAPMPQSGNTKTAAERVWGVGDLQLTIMSAMRPRELLVMQRVNRTAFAWTTSSRAIERSMFLLPDSSRRPATLDLLSSPHLGLCKHAFLWDTPEVEPGFEMMFTTRDDLDLDLPNLKLGDRVANLLICQPPIQSLTIRVDCPCSCVHITSRGRVNPFFMPLCETVTIPYGWRVSDLVRQTKFYLMRHKHCPFAPLKMHRDDGTVMASIRFSSGPILERDPQTRLPCPCRKCSPTPEEVRMIQEGNEKKKQTTYYMAAKTRAHRADRRIPTLEEFQVSQALVASRKRKNSN